MSQVWMLMPSLDLFFLFYMLLKVFATSEPQRILLIFSSLRILLNLCVTKCKPRLGEGAGGWDLGAGVQVFCPEGGAENNPSAADKSSSVAAGYWCWILQSECLPLLAGFGYSSGGHVEVLAGFEARICGRLSPLGRYPLEGEMRTVPSEQKWLILVSVFYHVF